MNNTSAVSTRVRLARNISGFPFPNKLSEESKQKIIDLIAEAVKNADTDLTRPVRLINMTDLTREQALSLVERRLVSHEFVSALQGRALLSDENSIHIMINEEDHIRIQIIEKNLALEDTLKKALELDNIINQKLNFSFDETLGYLTQCPTNLGTGMRASVMLHLPALQKNKTIGRIAGNLSKLGFTIRGSYGEGTEPKGAMYQLSNQVTLGITEQAAIENLRNITVQLINLENSSRESFVQNIDTQDKISRSLGILKYAKTLNLNESMELLSNLRLGAELNQPVGISIDEIDQLITKIQPANIIVSRNKSMNTVEVDIARAEIIQNSLT